MATPTYAMSELSTPASELLTPVEMEHTIITSSLEGLQTDEQRRILDTVGEIRGCGLDAILSLPQLVVCGDQSAGKSSVLEALTEIPFPRNDNLCTRFATEIHLRRAKKDTLTIKAIPDGNRPPAEKATIEAFKESITDFGDLPRVMNLAMIAMGITTSDGVDEHPRAFARDTLSIIIEGPNRPQLTLVDIPGLIATHTKVTTAADVALVAEITHHYISQPRTICLAVVSAMGDFANQKILDKVRQVDPDGDRTLGIITKPDSLPAGSGLETSFLELARNEDIKFKLGWHVVKNRKYEERYHSLGERNIVEETFFRTSNFKSLPKTDVGIHALRNRLSILLFEHVKKELPRLREDLNNALDAAQQQLALLGDSRSSVAECKSYLSSLSLKYWDTCKAAVNGHYEGAYFLRNIDPEFSIYSPSTIRRARAVIQSLNSAFSDDLRRHGHKYQIQKQDNETYIKKRSIFDNDKKLPQLLTKDEALAWVGKVMVRTRGMELAGNFNPLLVGELFWEQSSRWHSFATAHIENVSQICSRFLRTLLQDKCPKDVENRIWAAKVEDALESRTQAAFRELDLIMEDMSHYPMNYNHYYTDTILKQRQDRQNSALTKSVTDATRNLHFNNGQIGTPHIEKIVTTFSRDFNPDMSRFSSQEALDCLFAIYKVSQKTFVANITTQVIERHIFRGLETIFSPIVVNALSDAEVVAIASEPTASINSRNFLVDQIKKLEAGHKIFKGVL